MNHLLAIAGGGAAGAIMRYLAANWVYGIAGRDFPYGTLAVNVSGSLLMGFGYVLLTERLLLAPEWRAVLLIGFLGAFTTFSTFSIETVNLLMEGEAIRALLNMLLSVLLCVGAAWLGLVIGRAV